MMNLTSSFQQDWKGIGWFFIGRLSVNQVLAEQGIWRKTGFLEKRKNKLIDIGLRVAFSGYWKLFMDGNSLDIGFLWLLIPVNQLMPNVYSSLNRFKSRFPRF
jgi:hypothetical protein